MIRDEESRRRTTSEVHDLRHCASCGARELSLCATVPLDQLAVLEGHSRVFDLAAGAGVFDQGDVPAYVYTVIRGCVRLTTDMLDGRRQVHGFPMPGDYFGLTPQRRYDYAASALMPSRLCRIHLDSFYLLLDEMQPINQSLHLRDERMLCSARLHATALGRKTALERVAGFLVECLRHPARASLVCTHDAHGHPVAVPPADGELRLPMTRADIADYLGLTLETVSRSFGELRRSGRIQLPSANVLRIPDLAALEKLAAAG